MCGNGLPAQWGINYQEQPCAPSCHQGLHSACCPRPLPRGLLLDGIQDAPHILIHLQALQQKRFTGKEERQGLALAPGPKGGDTARSSPHCVRDSATWVTGA